MACTPITIRISIHLMIVFLMAGCASVASRVQEGSEPVGDGVVYHMPKRPIKISVTIPKDKDASPAVPSVDTISATADLSKRFLLNFQSNWFGRNHANIGVNTNGLLTTSTAETTSGIPTLVQNIGKLAGAISALAVVPPGPSAPTCTAGHTYTMLLSPEKYLKDLNALNASKRADEAPKRLKIPLCDFLIEVTNLDGNAIEDHAIHSTARIGTEGQQYGVFYKQELPYLVTIEDSKGGAPSQLIAFSPNLAPISYIPVTRGFFANNQTNITLSEGIVTAVDSVTTGELVALSELPADFITAYTTAIGALFTQLGNNAQAQTTLINNQSALAVATVKRTACTSTIEANKAALGPSNLAEKTGDDLKTAVANINDALTNVQAACK